MTTSVQRLGRGDEPAIEDLLQTDPLVNLFLLGFLGVHSVDRAWWYGASRGSVLRGVALVLPGRLVVPFAPDDAAAAAIGDALRESHDPSMLVGPRPACDALWRRWSPNRLPTRCYDQRLYVLDTPSAGSDPPGFRRAGHAEWPRVAELAGLMEEEDLGTNPYHQNPRLHEQVVQERLKAGRTWIIDDADDIRFQVNVGTTTRQGCQVGGTYVPEAHRGRGYATLGIAATCRRLLQRYATVTLHVNEANVPAVRVYEKVGFVRGPAFRLITPPPR